MTRDVPRETPERHEPYRDYPKEHSGRIETAASGMRPPAGMVSTAPSRRAGRLKNPEAATTDDGGRQEISERLGSLSVTNSTGEDLPPEAADQHSSAGTGAETDAPAAASGGEGGGGGDDDDPPEAAERHLKVLPPVPEGTPDAPILTASGLPRILSDHTLGTPVPDDQSEYELLARGFLKENPLTNLTVDQVARRFMNRAMRYEGTPEQRKQAFRDAQGWLDEDGPLDPDLPHGDRPPADVIEVDFIKRQRRGNPEK